MRVVSGKYKGKMLKSPTSTNIRPTGDKVKQALFTKLQFDIPNCTFLDLFCGSGAMGIEALSRGAKSVFFVDKDKRSCNLTKQNLLGINEDYRILNCSYENALNKLIDKKFDIIFVDPPYASGVYENVLNIIKNNNLLSEQGMVICEHPNNLVINTDFILFDQKRYGTVTLSFYSL